MAQLLKSIKNLLISLFILDVKISLYVVNFVFRTKIGYALYFFAAFFFFLLQSPSMAFPPTFRFLYLLSVVLFYYIMESGLEIYILYRLPWLKQKVEGSLGADFMQRMVGDSSGTILLTKVLGPFYFFLLIDLVDYVLSISTQSREWAEYLKKCAKNNQEVDSQMFEQIRRDNYSYIMRIRRAFYEFFKQV